MQNKKRKSNDTEKTNLRKNTDETVKKQKLENDEVSPKTQISTDTAKTMAELQSSSKFYSNDQKFFCDF